MRFNLCTICTDQGDIIEVLVFSKIFESCVEIVLEIVPLEAKFLRLHIVDVGFVTEQLTLLGSCALKLVQVVLQSNWPVLELEGGSSWTNNALPCICKAGFSSLQSSRNLRDGAIWLLNRFSYPMGKWKSAGQTLADFWRYLEDFWRIFGDTLFSTIAVSPLLAPGTSSGKRRPMRAQVPPISTNQIAGCRGCLPPRLCHAPAHPRKAVGTVQG